MRPLVTAMARGIPFLLIIIFAGAVLAACGGDDESKGRSLSLGGLTFSDHGTKSVSGKAEFELEADTYYFNPTFLQGQPGQALKLEIENESSTTHSFTVKALNVDKDIPAKAKVTVEITFPQSGALLFFCKYHTDQGMNGELLVGNATPQPPSSSTPTRSGQGAY